MQSIRHPLQSFVFLFLMAFALHASAVPVGPVIGKVTLVLGTVQGVDQDGDAFEVSRGADLYAGYTLTTGSRGMVRATMNDGTTLTLGRDSDATLDNFEFDASSGAGGFDATVRRGGFEYESGELGKFAMNRQHSSISTPAGVIGVRGTKLVATVNKDGTLSIKLMNGAIEVATFSGTYSYDSSTGEVTITTSPDGPPITDPDTITALNNFQSELEDEIEKAIEEGPEGTTRVEGTIEADVDADEDGGIGDLEETEDGELKPVSPIGSPET